MRPRRKLQYLLREKAIGKLHLMMRPILPFDRCPIVLQIEAKRRLAQPKLQPKSNFG